MKTFINTHFCSGCLETAVGPRGASVLMQVAKEMDLPEEFYFLLLRAGEFSAQHHAGLQFDSTG